MCLMHLTFIFKSKWKQFWQLSAPVWFWDERNQETIVLPAWNRQQNEPEKLSLAKLRLLQTLYNSRKIVQDSGKVIVSEQHWWNTDRYNTSRCAAICKQTARSTQTNSSWKSLKEIYCYILDKISDHRCIVNVFYWKCKTWLLKLLLLSEEKTFTPADVYHLQSNL